jgi:hypothetical protein
MSSSEFRDMIEQADFQPYVIKTKGGRKYPITHRANAFIFEAYPSTVVIAVPGQGLTLLGLDSIESIQLEHDVAALGR